MCFTRSFGKQTVLVAVLALGTAGCGGSKAERAQTPPPMSLYEPIRVEEKKPVAPVTVIPADEYTKNTTVTPLPVVSIDSAKPDARPTGIVSGEGGQTYTMQKGDTLYGIARKFNVGAKQIVAANNFKDPNKLSVGTKVRIP